MKTTSISILDVTKEISKIAVTDEMIKNELVLLIPEIVKLSSMYININAKIKFKLIKKKDRKQKKLPVLEQQIKIEKKVIDIREKLEKLGHEDLGKELHMKWLKVSHSLTDWYLEE